MQTITEKRLVLKIAIFAAIAAFFVTFLMVAYIAYATSFSSSQAKLSAFVVISATFFAAIVGHFFAKKLLRVMQQNAHCNSRAFVYGVLTSFFTAVLTVFAFSTLLTIIAAIGILAEGKHFIWTESLGSFMGFNAIGFIAITINPIFWLIYGLSGIAGIRALAHFRNKINII